MNESPYNEGANDDLIDLAAGEKSFAEGVRMRVALLFDRAKAAEYADLRRLRREMRSLGTVFEVPPAPLWPAPARPAATPVILWGKFTMKRRNVFAAYAVLFLTMTGIAVARQWLRSEPLAPVADAAPKRIRDDSRNTGGNGPITLNPVVASPAPGAAGGRQGRQESRRLAHILLSTLPTRSANEAPTQPLIPEAQTAREADARARAESILADIRAGKITFEDAARKYSEDAANAAKGGDLGVMTTGQLDPEFEKVAFGIRNVGDVVGPVKSNYGYHLIKLLARSADAPPDGNDNTDDEAKYRELLAYYGPNPRFPIEDRRGGESGVGSIHSLPGSLCAYDLERGVSWKLVGYGKVEVRRSEPPYEGVGGQTLTIDWDKAKRAASPEGRKNLRRLRQFAPRPDAPPVLYWALAGKAQNLPYYPTANGWWKSVRQTGTFKGYGKHEIRDESGKIIVTLTVTPL